MSHTLRRLALGFASVLTLAPALAGAARAGDVTYPQLQNQSTVIDTDLLAAWRNTGPLAKINASTLAAYLQGKFNSDYLQIGNSLSELAGSAATARANLGLQSAALASVGASGAAVCLLNANCTWSGTELFQARITTGAPTGAGAMFNLAPGAAPTSPVNGDVWMTPSGEFERVNGATQQVAYTNSSITGNAATATALQNSQTIGASGAVSCSATSFNGTAGITLPCSLSNTGVANGSYGDSGHVAAFNVGADGRISSASSVAISYPSQFPTMNTTTVGNWLTNNGSSVQWSPRSSMVATGCNAGGCIISGSANVLSLSRIGTGHYTMYFTNWMPSTNYTFECTVGVASVTSWGCQEDAGGGLATDHVSFWVTNSSGTPQDSASAINVLVIGNP